MVSFWHLHICASWVFSLPLSVPHLSYCRAVTRFLREARFGEWIGALGVTSAVCVSFPLLEVCSHCTDFPIWRKVKWIFKKLPMETPSQDTFCGSCWRGRILVEPPEIWLFVDCLYRRTWVFEVVFTYWNAVIRGYYEHWVNDSELP